MTTDELARLSQQVLWASFFVSMALGALVQRSGFCTMGAVGRRRHHGRLDADAPVGPGRRRRHHRLRRAGLDRAGQPGKDPLRLQPLDLAVGPGGRRYFRLRHGAVLGLRQQGAGARGRGQPEGPGGGGGAGRRRVRHPEGPDGRLAHPDGGPGRTRFHDPGQPAGLGGAGLRPPRRRWSAWCWRWPSAAPWWPGPWPGANSAAPPTCWAVPAWAPPWSPCGGSAGTWGSCAEHPETLQETFLATNSTRAEALQLRLADRLHAGLADVLQRPQQGAHDRHRLGVRRHRRLGRRRAGAAHLPLGRLRRHRRPRATTWWARC